MRLFFSTCIFPKAAACAKHLHSFGVVLVSAWLQVQIHLSSVLLSTNSWEKYLFFAGFILDVIMLREMGAAFRNLKGKNKNKHWTFWTFILPSFMQKAEWFYLLSNLWIEKILFAQGAHKATENTVFKSMSSVFNVWQEVMSCLCLFQSVKSKIFGNQRLMLVTYIFWFENKEYYAHLLMLICTDSYFCQECCNSTY